MLNSCGSPDLYNGNTLASFSSWGNIPCINVMLYTWAKGSHICCTESFRVSDLIPSYPGAPFFKDINNLYMSWLVTGSRNIVLEILFPINDSGIWGWFDIPLARFGPMFTKNVLKFSLIVTLLSVMVSSCNLNFSWTRFDLFKLIIPLSIVQVFSCYSCWLPKCRHNVSFPLWAEHVSVCFWKFCISFHYKPIWFLQISYIIYFYFYRLFEAFCQPRFTVVIFQFDFSFREVYIMKPQKYFVKPGED